MNFILLLVSLSNTALTPLPKYKYVAQAKNWYDAETYCEHTHGYPSESGLAIIRSSSDNDLVSQLCPGSHGRCWIGLSDTAHEGHWKWAPKGEIPTYTNWHGGQPDNAGNEDCVELHHSSTKKWNDLPCTSSIHFICNNDRTQRGYFRGNEIMTWLGAYRYCRNRNSILASITDARDAADAHRVCGNANCWLGINDIDQESRWMWLDGTPNTYTNWRQGEPNNLNTQHCGYICQGTNGKWDDGDCIPWKGAYPLCNPAGSHNFNGIPE